jgi:hypothetical protein
MLHSYCITFFHWDFISFCHIVSLQQSKIRVLIWNWKGCNRKPFEYFHICWFYFHDHNTLAKISDFRVYAFVWT